MSRPHRIDRVKAGTLAAGQQPPQAQARNLEHYREHATLCLHARREADGTEQAATYERRVRAAIAIFANTVDDDVETARQDACEVLTLVVDRRRAQLADEHHVLAARGAPQLEAGQPSEHEQRLTDGAGGAVHEYTLASLHAGGAMQALD